MEGCGGRWGEVDVKGNNYKMCARSFFSQQTRIEGEVLGQIRQIGAQKAKNCSYTA